MEEYKEQEPNDDSRMTLEDAQDEANMIRGLLALQHEQPTKENYDKALKSLEKILERAEDPSIPIRMAAALIVILEGCYKYFLAIPIFVIGTPINAALALAGKGKMFDNDTDKDREKAKETLGKIRERIDALKSRK